VLDAVREDRRNAAPSRRYWRAPRTIVDAEAISRATLRQRPPCFVIRIS